MKRGNIWKISILTTAEAEDAVSELLSTVFGGNVSSYVDAEKDITSVAVYCDKKPGQFTIKRAALKAGVLRIKECGLDVGAGRISVKQIRREDWAESWKRHFKPIEIGEALLVKPSWSKRRAKPNQAVVILDPGLSFGTGQHPTTGFCLHELVRLRNPQKRQSFLDIGTGSGILAIAAAKLGYSPVHAFDFDVEAVRVARGNARINKVLHKMRIVRFDMTKLPPRPTRKYDLVCANLISTLLVAERRRIARLLKSKGALVTAGILKSEFPEVQNAYEASGLHLLASRVENEWCSGTFGANH